MFVLKKLSKIIYPTCHCTNIGETFIHCEQRQASERGSRQDVALTNQQTLSETVSGTQIFNEYEVLNTDESRERRLDHFSLEYQWERREFFYSDCKER